MLSHEPRVLLPQPRVLSARRLYLRPLLAPFRLTAQKLADMVLEKALAFYDAKEKELGLMPNGQPVMRELERAGIAYRAITYEVDQILTVEPEDMEPLGIDAQQDYCTLVTCTPYGINTHRLLVRGHRVPNQEADGASVASRVDYAPVVAGAGAALVLAGIALRAIARRKN